MLLVGCNREVVQTPQDCAPCPPCLEMKGCPPPPEPVVKESERSGSAEGFWCQVTVKDEDATWMSFCHRNRDDCTEAGKGKGGITSVCTKKEAAWCFSSGLGCSLEKGHCLGWRDIAVEIKNDMSPQVGGLVDDCILTY